MLDDIMVDSEGDLFQYAEVLYDTPNVEIEHVRDVILIQYSGYNDEENLDENWESDLLEIKSPRGKFIAEVVKEHGTIGMVAVKDCIVDYFTDHWNDHFMPLIDLYWNENGDDGCLPKSKRLGSKYENPELLNKVD